MGTHAICLLADIALLAPPQGQGLAKIKTSFKNVPGHIRISPCRCWLTFSC